MGSRRSSRPLSQSAFPSESRPAGAGDSGIFILLTRNENSGMTTGAGILSRPLKRQRQQRSFAFYRRFLLAIML